MLKIKYFIKIIRWPNLLIIAITMYLMRYCLLQPLLETNGLFLIQSHIKFFLLTLSTVLIAASGYIINDLNDIDADKINKPEKLIAGKYLSIKFLDNMYLFLNFFGIALGVYVSYSTGLKTVSVVFLLVAGLLYFYSTTYKVQLILGNIMVAVFSALVPFMVFIFDMPLIRQKFREFESTSFNFNYIIAWFAFYAFFAFIITLTREIIKDIEDFEGDKAYGKHSLPVAFGTQASKLVVISLLLFLLIIICFSFFRFLNDAFSLIYIVPFIIAPIIYVLFILIKAKEKLEFTKASFWCKAIMITGILYTLLVKFVLLNPSAHS